MGYFSDQFGGKYLIMVAIMGASISSLFTPLIYKKARPNYHPFFALRAFNGFCQGFLLPSLFSILVYWTPKNMRTTIVCIGLSTSSFGYMEWTSIYYIFGSLGVIWCAVWYVFCYSRPYLHPFISAREKSFLTEELGEEQLVFTQKEVPWRSIIRSRPLWALLINHVGIIWCTYTFGTRMPDYVKEVLKVSYELQTYWELIMVFPVFVATIIYGCFSDWLIAEKHINITVLRKYSVAFRNISDKDIQSTVESALRDCLRDTEDLGMKVIDFNYIFLPPCKDNECNDEVEDEMFSEEQCDHIENYNNSQIAMKRNCFQGLENDPVDQDEDLLNDLCTISYESKKFDRDTHLRSFDSDDIFVEKGDLVRIRLDNTPKVIKKSSLCWLLDNEKDRVSVDRVKRFIQNKKCNSSRVNSETDTCLQHKDASQIQKPVQIGKQKDAIIYQVTHLI
ncbi:hypothetical protein Zmor_022625 [Zophobas morio]|uniref:Uncharacterized protein n=1 Tax=Zophobas morio TaxID=2755281 RepID=A0AA38HWD1_9CUCU|nr:hypothetical protein Zmor_022625 [Zophobas morio]